MIVCSQNFLMLNVVCSFIVLVTLCPFFVSSLYNLLEKLLIILVNFFFFICAEAKSRLSGSKYECFKYSTSELRGEIWGCIWSNLNIGWSRAIYQSRVSNFYHCFFWMCSYKFQLLGNWAMFICLAVYSARSKKMLEKICSEFKIKINVSF